MASYSSYRKISSARIVDNSVVQDKLQVGAATNSGVTWVYSTRAFNCQECANNGGCVCQACGRCCLFTVPSGVTKVTFEIWSGGGGGAGHTCCNCCSFSIGGAGGNYGIKTINVSPGWTYTVCAGGSWNCSKSHTCGASMGCRSYVTGCNLSNFCTTGGCGGIMCNGNAWGQRVMQSCANCNICGIFGADFGIMGTTGWKNGHGGCHCRGADFNTTGMAPMIGKFHTVGVTEAWCSCGCYVNWPAGGGASGQSAYCGNNAKCCAGGSGQGGSGIVKITYA